MSLDKDAIPRDGVQLMTDTTAPCLDFWKSTCWTLTWGSTFSLRWTRVMKMGWVMAGLAMFSFIHVSFLYKTLICLESRPLHQRNTHYLPFLSAVSSSRNQTLKDIFSWHCAHQAPLNSHVASGTPGKQGHCQVWPARRRGPRPIENNWRKPWLSVYQQGKKVCKTTAFRLALSRYPVKIGNGTVF